MRWCVALFLFLAIAGIANAGGAQIVPTVDEILDRAKAATGSPPDNYREAITSTGTGGETKTTIFHIGKDVRRVSDHDGQSGVFRGEAWRQTSNGLTIVDDRIPAANAMKP